MTNANELGNQNTGQSEDFVGQDEAVDTQETSTQNWEEQAKYFQSEKDKLSAENQKLKQYEEVGKFLESRPDIVDNIKGQVQGGQPAQPQRVTLKPDEFDPWEAYNDPSSASYKFRMQEMQEQINGAVNNATQGIRQQTGRANLQAQLQSQGLTAEETADFMSFADKHPSEYGLENVVKMWRAVSQDPATTNESPLDQIRNVQGTPQAGGVLQGERPHAPKSDSDEMWSQIVGSGDKNVF
jgi:hypothetical protein